MIIVITTSGIPISQTQFFKPPASLNQKLFPSSQFNSVTLSGLFFQTRFYFPWMFGKLQSYSWLLIMLPRSALMTAASEGHISIVRLFLQHNANTELKDSQGWKASDHAVIHGHHRLGRQLLFWHRDATSKWTCCFLWLVSPTLDQPVQGPVSRKTR